MLRFLGFDEDGIWWNIYPNSTAHALLMASEASRGEYVVIEFIIEHAERITEY